uniref:ABC-2 type transporter transmembrane domain-containing protein n=1 Tax=Megaselia scalaris TaxID=36166 RepID=T1GX15_MEGSC
MFDHLKFCVGCILVIVYTQVMTPILSYSMEVKLVKKEYFNRWYSLTAYYMALTVSRIPLQIFFNIVFLSLVYYLAGLPPQLWRFCLFSLAGLMVSFAAEGFGLAIGATFSMV